MGIFGTRDVPALFRGMGFNATRTIIDPPRIAMLPSVFVDDPARRWAVRMPGSEPVIFSFDDIVDCRIVEREPAAPGDRTGGDLLQRILANPARVSRDNAARRGDVCLGLGVAVFVRTGPDEVSTLQIPVLTAELKRSSRSFEQARSLAERLKAAFDGMRGCPAPPSGGSGR